MVAKAVGMRVFQLVHVSTMVFECRTSNARVPYVRSLFVFAYLAIRRRVESSRRKIRGTADSGADSNSRIIQVALATRDEW